jgi:outer membrane receptor protein involved in Fe transport
MICGVALLGLSATQAAAQQAQQGAEVSEIVVTGSRIPSPNLTSVSPVTAVTSQDIKLQGTATVESMLNRLPQVVASQSSTVANGSTGIATVNLRGLGPGRTAVLIDGRRLMPGDPIQPVADLNNIPAALVDRVDVLTGGASAVYGSDAIGGVVNFIMNRNFEGFRIDAQYNTAQHDNGNDQVRDALTTSAFPIPFPTGSKWDGQTYEVTTVMGVNAPDGKGNVTAYAGYRHLNALLQSQRDYSACSIITTYSSDPTIYDTRQCAGSSNNAFGRFRGESQSFAGGTLPRTGRVSVNPNGTRTFVPYSGAFAFNYGPLNYFQRPEERWTAGYFAHYDVNDAVKLYSDFMFADDHTVAQIAPSGLFQGTGPSGTSTFKINCDNPLMSASQASTLCGAAAGTPLLRDVTVGFRFTGLPRQDNLRHTNYRIVLGSKGDLGQGWSYDAYLLYGTSIFNEHYDNDVSLRKAQNALLVDPKTGQCTSDATGGCVPLDIFRFGALTPAMLNYVVTPGFKSGETVERVASASVTGELGQYGVKSPWATDGVGVAFGTEYRRENLELDVDDEFRSGDLSGQGGPTLPNHGGYDVYELFGEARVPIAQDMPFAKNLDLELGYRFSDYSTDAGVTHTYKVGINYQPIDDIKLRASYNRAVRAPNIVELFSPRAVGLFGGADPCAANNTGHVPATFAQCARSGVTAAQYAAGIDQCPAAQCSAIFGGNLALKAEEADTYTVGFILQPRWLKGFDVSVDWYDIKVDNLISALPELTLIDCVINGNTTACGRIHRDPSTGAVFGQVGIVDATNINTGFLKTSGIDINANYRTNFADWGLGEYGGLNFSFVGTWTDKYEVQPTTGGGSFDCKGLYGPVCSAITGASTGPIPEWKHVFRITWTPPWVPVTASLAWRYISSVEFDGNQSNVFLADPLGRKNVLDNRIDSQNYLDIAGTWKIRDTMTLRFGVNNILDNDPPIVDSNNFPASGPPYGNGNTYPGTYDALGRMIFVGLTADF